MAHKFYNDRLIPGIELWEISMSSSSIGTFKVSQRFITTSSEDV